MLNVGHQLGELFGSDLVDYQVLRFVKQSIWMSATLLKSPKGEHDEVHLEDTIPLAWTKITQQDVFSIRGAWPSAKELRNVQEQSYEFIGNENIEMHDSPMGKIHAPAMGEVSSFSGSDLSSGKNATKLYK